MARRSLLTCALAAALAGCAAEQASVPPPPLTAEVEQYRRDLAPRILSVAVTNLSQRAVVVRRLDLVAAGFADDPAADSRTAGGARRSRAGPLRRTWWWCSYSSSPGW